LGEHNLKNIAQVFVLAKLLKIPQKDIKKSLENFRAVEGRLEYLGQKKGIDF
jgi:UDP-N-acetylmuramoylalanine--D-glutamate ligase